MTRDGVLSISALAISLLALLFGGYFNATWDASVDERSVIPSVEVIGHELTFQDQDIEIPQELQQRSDSARYFADLPVRLTRSELEAIVDGTSFADYRSASISLQAAADRLEMEDITVQDTVRIWGNISSSAKAVLFTMRSVRLLASELRVTEDRIPALVDRFLEQGDAVAEDDGFLDQPEVRSALEQVLLMAARAEFAPDATELAALIREEVPRIDDLADEYEYFASEIEELIAGYEPDTVWKVGVKFYNEGRSPAALLPIAVMAIQRPAEGNSTIFMRAIDIAGNVIVPPGEGVDAVFRSVVDDNDGNLLRSLATNFDGGTLDFRVVFQYLDGERLESDVSNFSAAITDSLRDELKEYAEDVGLAR